MAGSRKLLSIVLVFLFAFMFSGVCFPGAENSDISSKRITVNLAGVDIDSVLDVIAEKGNVSIVSSPDVKGTVRVRLTNVPWNIALDTILGLYGYGYKRRGDIISVFPLENLNSAVGMEALESEVITLQYLDAKDAKKSLEPQLSNRGKITVVERRGKKGWEFTSAETGKADEGADFVKGKRVAEEPETYSRTLIITDVPSQLEIIRGIIAEIDKQPRQILIQTRIMEVNKDRLKDIGFDWGTGSNGATTTTITPTPVDKKHGMTVADVGGNILGSQVSPSAFLPKAAAISGVTPFNTGLTLLYQHLTGTQFEVMLHALEEDVHGNTLSAPRITTLENQEATILVGTKYPILKSDITGTTTTTVTASLDYYQNIGIQLNVLPQVNQKGQINMIIHPAISSSSGTLKSYGSSNQVVAEYPIILTREAETQVLLEDGETIVIGGLLKDVKSESKTGVPILRKIPFLGKLFERQTVDTEKIDLLIFITANILKNANESAEILSRSSELIKNEPLSK